MMFQRIFPWYRLKVSVHIFSVYFVRLLAVMWIAKGLVGWGALLGVAMPVVPVLETLSRSDQFLVMIFSVIDLVAGVALWLSPQWGGVVWLIAVAAEILRQLVSDPSLGRQIFLAAMFVVFVIYVTFRYISSTFSDQN